MGPVHGPADATCGSYFRKYEGDAKVGESRWNQISNAERDIAGVPSFTKKSEPQHHTGFRNNWDYRGRTILWLPSEKPFQECRGHMTLLEIGVVEDPAVEWNGGLDAFDDEFVEGTSHADHRLLTITPVGN